ncbi:hypothetical protein LguiB_034335 [Lonicera macranthoides]
MAVQAQYPSNVLFLNRNLVVEQGKNQLGPSLHPQPSGGAILDHSHNFLFNSNSNNVNIGVGTNNPRKRGREGTTATTTTPINSFISMQTQAPQNPIPRLIDLTQLHNPHPNVVSTGLQLAFQDQQQQLRLSNHQHTLSSQSSSLLSSLLSQDFQSQINQQTDEVQQFLHTQEEHLRRMLAEKRQRQFRELVGAAEESAARRLREKEAEAEKAARRNAELEARAAQLCAEARSWQATAAAREATAAALQAELRRAMLSGGFAREEEEGGGLGRAIDEGAAKDAESAYVDPERVVETPEARGPICRGCGRRVASVVLLPCQHLSVCRECDGVVEACPLCLSVRSSSVEVLLS